MLVFCPRKTGTAHVGVASAIRADVEDLRRLLLVPPGTGPDSGWTGGGTGLREPAPKPVSPWYACPAARTFRAMLVGFRPDICYGRG